MKRVLLWSVVLSAAFAANAAYTPVEWIKASGTQWINTKYTPKCTDKIEMKVNFATKSGTQCLYCSRGTTTTTATFTSFLLSSKIRVDRNNAAGGSIDFAIAANTDYVLTVDYNARKATLTDGTTTKELTNLTDGTFAPGSPLALFASHTSGTGLTDGTSMGNWGSYKLTYVKIYDKDGNLVREYVPVKDGSVDDPRCQVGLYEKVTQRFCPCNFKDSSVTTGLTCGNATGAPDVDKRDEYVLTVEKGAVLNLEATHVQAAAGKTFVKAGGGTLYVAGDVMKDFAGNIRVRDGYYVMQSANALGTEEGQTFVEDGGTLINQVVVSKTDGSGCSFPNEVIHLKGVGCEGWGALRNKASCVDFCRTVYLDGPARIVADVRLDFRSTAFEMNWFPLEVRVSGSGSGFYIVGEKFSHMGDIDLKTGYIEFQSSLEGTLSTATVTIREGATFGFWGCSGWLSSKVVFEPNTTIKSTNGAFKYEGTDNRNIFSTSPVTLQGAVKNDLNKNTQYQFRSKVTGDGGIEGGKGGYLQLINSAGDNDFKDGLDIAGVVENGNPVGGVVAYYDGNIPAGDGAAPLKLKNASLQQRNGAVFHLPDLVADGRVVVSNMATVTNCTAKSLKKTGADELTVFGPLSVAGEAEIDAGTVRFATQVPDYVPGLYWAGTETGANASDKTDLYTEALIKENANYQGVDSKGMSYAYQKWPGGKGFYQYVGYFKVPGEPGESRRCRFSSCAWRYTHTRVDDVLVLHIADASVSFPANAPSIGWNRHYWSDPVTLTSGWHRISFAMYGTYYSADNGPQPCATASYGLWPENFGLGVDFNASETLANQAKDENEVFVDATVTNSARYVKFTDPGDGSFLRAFINRKSDPLILDPETYRPTFKGGLTVAGGAVLDINDAEPYVPFEVSSLTGLPTVKNGAVTMGSSTWTIRKADILDENGEVVNKPLTLADASLAFPKGDVTIAPAAADIAALTAWGKARSCPIVADPSAFGDTKFVLSDAFKDAGWRLRTVEGVLCLEKRCGLTLIIR